MTPIAAVPVRLTSRGWTVLAVLALAVALSWQHGPRALNAVVTPLVVVLLAGAVLIARTDRPTVRRSRIDNGAVGDARSVEFTVESGATIAADVTDSVGDGLAVSGSAPDATDTADSGSGNRLAATAVTLTTTIDGEERLAYDVTLERRGEHVVGPLTITVTDAFGLVERRFSYEATTTVVAYPAAYELRSGSAGDLRALEDAASADERDAFDHLREYRRGDPLRDVHWKAAAKRPDDELVVTEYDTDDEAGAITIAAECDPERTDRVVRAVASVATHLLERDRRVGVTIGDERLPPGSGHEHRRELLGLLAVAKGGELADRDRERADVLVTATWRDVRVVTDGRTIPFPRLLDETAETGRQERIGSGRGRRREAGVIA